LPQSLGKNLARHPQITAAINRLKSDSEVIAPITGSRDNQLFAPESGTGTDSPAGRQPFRPDLAIGLKGQPFSAGGSNGNAGSVAVDRDHLWRFQPIDKVLVNPLPLISGQPARSLLGHKGRLIAPARIQLVSPREA
jgi:hypothetical protein